MNSIVRSWRTLSIVLAFAAVAGCATTSGRLDESAERLEHGATALERNAEPEGGSYARDTHELAEDARYFRATLKNRSADDEDVRKAFAELSRSYHATRDDVEARGNPEAQRELAQVTQAYLDFEGAMTTNPPPYGHYER